MRYARVIVGMNHPQTDRVFDYHIPEAFQDEAKEGVRVIVPFGRRNTKTEGYILSLAEESEIPLEKLKDILEILDDGRPIFTPQMLHLAQWMKEHYFCTLNQCLQAIMPTGIKTKSTWQVLLNEAADVSACKGGELAVLEALKEMGGSSALSELEKLLGSGVKNAIQQMQKRKYFF
ncbi:hypothetical protein [Anaerotignum propionicum]|uniref:Primosomal protein N n=1 Tax=Anaerotignum propionicum DSM 1682 TaxID=991789 RepID=A0ABN4LEW6_ANAPI|nr:hypothetical protein [Anaerotignum propionicum]AMJ41857.1 primosomal protein N' [Anaerotignum propionicum DSM 1682]